MKRFIYFLLIIFTVFLLNSCQKQKEEVIVFDDTYPLALAPDVEWALITDPYAAYKSDMNWNANIFGHCRKGEILQVLGKSIDSDNSVWYKFEEGWLPSSCLSIYSNRYKAQTALNNIKD